MLNSSNAMKVLLFNFDWFPFQINAKTKEYIHYLIVKQLTQEAENNLTSWQ